MNFIIGCAIAVVLVAGTAVGDMELVKIAAKQCQSQYDATHEELAALGSMEPAKSDKTNCLYHCFMQKFQMIKQIPNGQSLDLDKIIMLSKMKGVSASELEGIKSVIEPCTSITNSDDCAFGKESRECLINQMKAQNVDLGFFPHN